MPSASKRLQRLHTKRTLTAAEVIELLKLEQGERSMRGAARDWGVSAAFLCDVYWGRRLPGKKLLTALKLKRVVKPAESRYERA